LLDQVTLLNIPKYLQNELGSGLFIIKEFLVYFLHPNFLK